MADSEHTKRIALSRNTALMGRGTRIHRKKMTWINPLSLVSLGSSHLQNDQICWHCYNIQCWFFLYNVLGISSRIKSEAVLMQSKLFKNEGLLPLTHCCKCVCSCASWCKFVCTVFVCTSLCYSSNLFISVCNYWLSIAGVFSRYRSTRSLFSNHFVPYPNEYVLNAYRTIF